MGTSVADIHGRPLRPSGFEEPLFLGPGDKKAIAEHLRESSGWLRRADDVPAGGSRRAGEVCHVLSRPDGNAYLVRAGRDSGGRGCRSRRTKKRRVARVVERWREVRSWWEPGRGTDWLCFRVLLSDGAVVDLALERLGERAGSWSLVRVLD